MNKVAEILMIVLWCTVSLVLIPHPIAVGIWLLISSIINFSTIAIGIIFLCILTILTTIYYETSKARLNINEVE